MTRQANSSSHGSNHRIPLIGIVGGIGSGKSAVANWVAENSRVSVIDADALGHEALRSPSVIEALQQRFGNEILGADGSIVRSNLALRVFGSSDEHLNARKSLEAIVHPEIERKIDRAVAAETKAGSQAILLDAAILLETGWRNKCDLVVFIDTPDAVRLKRVLETRGWTETELRRREASQWKLVDKRRESDLIITNDSDLEHAGRQLLEVLQKHGLLTRNE